MIRQRKNYKILDINNQYLLAFQESKYPDYEQNESRRKSLNQYRSTLNRFFEFLSIDALMAQSKHIDDFLSSYPNNTNKARHIKSFYVFVISNNAFNSKDKVSKDLLFKLIEL